jgi:hypothetical protein
MVIIQMNLDNLDQLCDVCKPKIENLILQEYIKELQRQIEFLKFNRRTCEQCKTKPVFMTLALDNSEVCYDCGVSNK